MADSGTISFSLVDQAVKIDGRIYWAKSGSNATFYAKLTQAYSFAKSSKWVGNSLEQMRLGVDGTYTPYVSVAGVRTAGTGASGSDWRQNNDYAGAQTATITKAGKNSAYELTLRINGNGGTTGTYSVTIQFALPVWINDSGTLKQVEKAFFNDNGTIKECEVFFNDNGAIKAVK